MPPVEAKQSREKAEDIYEKEQMNQEPSFCTTIMEARGKNSGELDRKEEQYEPASHPCKCYEVLILLTNQGKVVTVRGLVDTGCTRSIILKIMVKRRDVNVLGAIATPLHITPMVELQSEKLARINHLFSGITTTKVD